MKFYMKLMLCMPLLRLMMCLDVEYVDEFDDPDAQWATPERFAQEPAST